MTAQDVIKAFAAKLANHGYSYSSSVGTSMLDSAVRASSRFSSIQDVIDAMKADQIKAEKEAVQVVLGSEYAGKTLAEIDTSILSANAKDYDGAKASNAYLNEWNDNRTTVEAAIKERKAYIFLEKYCGIKLPKRYWIKADGNSTYYGSNNGSTGNTDTGAITGSDANITLHSGDTDYYGNTLDSSALATKYGLTLENDGSLIIGTGTEKTDRSVVPETFINTYTASTTAAQKIITDSRNWVVKATDADDTITSGGADSINAGAGNDLITVNGDGATVNSGDGSDNIEISTQVRDVAISDFTAEDTMTINGSFEIGAAKIEDMMLIITDKTGKRKLRLGDFTNATNGKLNIDGASMTIGQWLTNSGIDLNNLENTTYAESVGVGSSNAQAPDNTEDNDGGRTSIDPEYTPTPLPEPVKTTEPTLTGPSRSANTNGNSPVTVNLANVDTNTAGNVEVDGQVVGTTSSTYPNATTFTRNGLTIHLLGETSDTSGNPNNIESKTFDELTDDQKAIIAALFKWWAAETINLNEESYGIGFNSDTTMCKDIGLYFFDGQGQSNTLATVWNWQRTYTNGTGDGFTTKLMLNVNMSYYNNLDINDMDGTSKVSGAGLLDRTLAHEMNHAIFASNINYFNSLPKFIKEGIAELTHGIDDERTSKIFKIAYDAEELDASLDISNTGTGTQAKGDGYAGGFMFYRYLAKQAALQTLNLPAFGEITATVNLNGNGIYYITGNSTSETAQIANTLPEGAIKLGTIQNGVYTVENSGVHQVINGSANVKIVGLTSNDTYNGTSGADTVQTAEGSKIITGAGNDSILLYGQYSTIEAGAGNDTVTIVEGNHHSINLGDGNNLAEVSSNSNNNTIYGGADNDYVIFGKIDGGKASYFIANNNYIDMGDGDDRIEFAGTNNTIIGGKGNDSIRQIPGGDGGNAYIFNGAFGNDTITYFMSNDTIHIANTYTTEFNDVSKILTVKKDDVVKGTIYISGAFDATTNVVADLKEKVSASEIAGLTYNESGYYEISDEVALRAFATYVNGGGDTLTKTFKITDDITLNGNWTTPIGNSTYNFTGTFDGNGKTISGLNGSNGLFGWIHANGTIQNVTLTNVNISGTDANIGALVGYNKGTVTDCKVSGNVSNTGTSAIHKVGGIVGYNYLDSSISKVINCTFIGTVSGTASNTGGIVGYNDGSWVKDNKVDGTITGSSTGNVGAIMGHTNGGTVSGNYYHGTQTTLGDGTTRVYKITLPEGVTPEDTITIGDNYYSAGSVTVDGKSYTVSADSTFVSYVDASGTEQHTFATEITADMATLSSGWYIVNGEINRSEKLNTTGEVNLILADGANLNIYITTNKSGAIYCTGTLSIYGQTEGTGKLNATDSRGITVEEGTLNINGGQITATGYGSAGKGIYSNNSTININGGQVTANSIEKDGYGIWASYSTINFGWTRDTDFINVSNYKVFKTLKFADGKRFYDASGNVYNGNVYESVSDLPSGKFSALNGYIVEIPAGVTITSDNAKQIGTTRKYICVANAQLTLSVDMRDTNFVKITKLNGADFTGTYTVTSDTALTLDGLPKISGLTFDTSGEFYKIEDAQDLVDLATYVNSGNDCAGLTFKLMNNIDLTADLNLSNFAGTFDGDNHLLTNVKDTIGGTAQNLYYSGAGTISGGTKVYKVTLPERVNITGTTYNFDNEIYAAADSSVTITAAQGYIFADDNQTLNYKITADTEITAPTVRGAIVNGVKWTLENNVLNITGNGTLSTISLETNEASTIKTINLGDDVNLTADISNLTALEAINVSAEKFATHLANLTSSKDKLTTSGTFENGGKTCNYTLTSDASGNVTLTINGTGEMPNMDFYPWGAARKTISSVVIGSGITSVSSSAFWDCENLTSISLPATLTSIDSAAFKECTKLTSITLPTGLTSIGSWAFEGCTSLTAIDLLDSLSSIGESAFKDCTNLTAINVSAEKFATHLANLTSNKDKLTASGTFANDGKTCNYTLTSDANGNGTLTINGTGEMPSMDVYPWGAAKSVISSVVIGSGITSVSSSAFKDCTNLTAINLPAGLTSIGESAFEDCTNLTAINLPAGLTSIGESAFKDCTNLTAINITSDKAIVIGKKVLGTGTVNIKDILGTSAAAFSYLDCADVEYLGSDGKTATATIAIKIGTNLTDLAAGNYYVEGSITLNDIELNGAVNLILKDGATLTTGKISGGTLNIYSQGGNNIGTFTAGDISSNVNFYGGNVTANSITGKANLSWTSANDSINATYSNVTLSKRFYDASGNIYSSSSTPTGGKLNSLDGYIVTVPDSVNITSGATQISNTNKYVVKGAITLTVDETKAGVVHAESISGLTKNNDDTYTATNDTTLAIVGLPITTGLSYKNGVYEISTAQALQTLATYTASHDCAGMTFNLTADIELSNFTGINNFAGTFNGGEYLITSNSAVFGNVNGQITGNIYGVSDSKLTRVYKVTAPEHFKVTSTNKGLIRNGELYASGDVSVTLTGDSLTNASFKLNSGDTAKLTVTEDKTLEGGEFYIEVNDGGSLYENSIANVSVLGSAGDDKITNNADNVTLNGGAGNDNINLSGGTDIIVNTAQGNDTIQIEVAGNVNAFTVENFTAGDEIQFVNSGQEILISELNAENGNLIAKSTQTVSKTVTIKGLNLYETFNKWYLNNGVASYAPTTIAGGYLDNGKISYAEDAIGAASLEINGVTSYENFNVNGSVVTLKADDFNTNATVTNNDGNYTLNITGTGSGKTFSGSAKNDSININSDGLTLSGISGKDTVSGSISTTKFIIGDNYTKTISGDDVVLAVGENSLTLKEAAKLDTLTIDGATVGTYFDVEGGKFLIKTSDDLQTLASYSTNHTTASKTFKLTNNIALPDNFTISDFSGTIDGDNHLITNVKANPFDNGAVEKLYYHGTAEINGATRVYTLNLPSGVTATTTATPIKFNDVNYYVAGTTFELSGHFADMSVNNVALTKLEKDKYSYTLGAADADVTTTAYAAEFIAKDTAWEYYENGYLQFTVDGLAKAPTVDMISDGVLRLTKDYLTTDDITLTNATGESYKLALNSNVPTTSTTAEAKWTVSGNSYSYKAASNSEYYTLNGNKITYTGTTGGEQFTISGIKSTDAVNVNNKTVTIAKDALQGSDVTLNSTDGYTLALNSNVPTTSTTTAEAKWTVSGDSYSYKAASNSEYYTLDGNKITYKAATGGEQFTISGIKSTDAVNVNNKTVTIAKDALQGSDVTLTSNDGYTLALNSNVPTTSTTTAEAKWTVSGDSYSYKAASNSEYYTLDGNKITYKAATGGEQFTISGIKSTDAVNVNNKTVTIAKDALQGSDVTLTSTDGYTLALNKNVPTSGVETAGSFTKSKNGIATYKTTAVSDYYTLKSNKITYTASTGGEKIKIANLKSNAALKAVKAGISVVEQKNGTYKITFNNSNILDAKAPTVTADKGISYKLAVASDLKPAKLAPDWKVSGTKAILKSYTSAGYTVKNNAVVYSKQKTGAAQMVLNGLSKNATLPAPVNKTLTLKASVLGSNTSLKSNDGNYTLKLTGNMSGKTFTGTGNADTLNIAANNAVILGGAGNDKFSVSGSKVTITGGKGNDTFSLSGKNPVLIYGAGEGNDTVNYVKGLAVSLSGNTELKTTNKSDSNLVLGFGKNSSIKVTDDKDITLIDANGKKIVSGGNFYDTKKISVTLSSSDERNIDLSKLGVKNVDASAISKATTIKGTASANLLIGGAANDKLYGNNGNDSIYGGKGNDSLSGGAGNDKLYGNDGKDTLLGGAGNDSLYGGNGNDKLYGNNGKDTLWGGAGNDSLYGGAGNDKLYGNDGKDTLWGGAGNDSLYGGNGNDTFIYKPGEGTDTIFDYSSGDMLQILKSDGSKGGTFSKAKFSGGDLTLTINGGGKVIFDGVSAGDKFNINGKKYTISGKTLK